jgi:hypothetical protein
MPHRRSLFLVAPSLLLLAGRRAEAFQLITPEEAAANRDDSGLSRTRGFPNPDLPQIEVISPDETRPLPAPVTISLRFRTRPGTTIVPGSFRATYGMLGIDITSRLLEHAQLTPAGLTVHNAAIPPGRHRVDLRIADAQNRVGERTFRFTVEG